MGRPHTLYNLVHAQAAVTVGTVLAPAAHGDVAVDDVAGWQGTANGGCIPFATIVTAALLGLIGRWMLRTTPSAPAAPEAPPDASTKADANATAQTV